MKKNKIVLPEVTSWKQYREQTFTPEEIAATDIKVALLGEIIKAREVKKLSQRKLETLIGVKQPVIARAEKGTSDPRLSTILKMLAASGKTLKVVPLAVERAS